MTPPSTSNKTPAVINKIRSLHKDIYTIGHKLNKRNKLGIHAVTGKLAFETLALAIQAAFSSQNTKKQILETLRVKIEVLKNLVRTENELTIIDERAYLRLSGQLIEISKDTSNWINYLTQNPPKAD